LLDLHGTDIQLINTEFEMKLLGKDGGAKKNKKNQSINQSINQSVSQLKKLLLLLNIGFQCPCSIP
jgi:hypothetical protein